MVSVSAPPLLLALACLAQIWRAYGDNYDDFSLEDALDLPTKKPIPKPPTPPKKPPSDTGDLDLSDFFDTPSKTATKSPPKKPDDSLWDILHTTTTKKPKATRAPPRKPAIDSSDFDLADALDDKNDGKGKPKPGTGGGSKETDSTSGGIKPEFSDADLDDLVNGGDYQPDKKKGGGGGGGGGGGSDSNSGTATETVTIAGIASALAMALIGAVSSYFSYQQKKFCFSIQQGLNAEYVKGENMEAVVAEEPQVKYTSLESQSAEPPKQDTEKV